MPISPHEPVSARHKAGVIAALVSAGALPVTSLPLIPPNFLSPSLRTLLLVCGFSFLGGFIATLFLSWRTIAARDGVRVGLACGSRAGAVGSVVAAACLLIGNAAAMRGKGFTAAPDFFPLLSACMSIVPGIAFGLLGALIAVLFRSPSSFARDIPRSPIDGSEPRKSVVHVQGILLTLLVIAAFLSPLFPIWFQARPKPALVVPPRPVKIAEPAPTPLPFHYVKPEGFSDADASRVTVIATKSLTGRISDSPIALDPNGKLLAYCAGGSSNPTVSIVDITTLAPVATASLSESIEHLAWSPDSTRIFCVGSGNQPPLTVLDLPSHRSIPLPVHKMASYNWPKGNLLWWAEEEVLIKESDEPRIFSLDSLRVLPVAQSEKWKGLSEADRKHITDTPTYILPGNQHWSMTVLPRSLNYSLINNNRACAVNSRATLALDSSESAYLRFFPEIGFSPNDVLLSTEDGSIFVRARGEDVAVFYFGLRDVPARSLSASSKTEFEKSDTLGQVKEIMAMHELRGFVCPPVINPLNQKVVDADRSAIHALMRFDSWKGMEASGWIVQDWQPISESDVVVDPNIFLNGGFNVLGSRWLQIASILSPDTPLPKNARGEATSFAYNPEFNTKTGHLVFVGLNPVKQKSPPPAATAPTEPQAPAATPAITPVPVKTPSAAEIERANKIRAFIRDHHQKMTRANIDVVADYADNVEYFGQNTSRLEINQQLLQFFNKSVQSLNTILGEIGIKDVSSTRFVAVYTLRYHNQDIQGGESSGVCDMYLEIQVTPNGPKIVKQSARDKKG
ncbi:MAG: hypothetical protein WCH57_01310 [Verrucomicrobiota bacterium]